MFFEKSGLVISNWLAVLTRLDANGAVLPYFRSSGSVNVFSANRVTVSPTSLAMQARMLIPHGHVLLIAFYYFLSDR